MLQEMRVKQILYLGLDPTNYQHHGELTHYPIIQTVPRPISDPEVYAALSLFDHYTHLIISSKTSIPILLDYLPKTGFSLKRWAEMTTLAVGQATMRQLQRSGISNILTAENETAEGIVDLIKNTVPTSAYLFWPHSSGARSVIKDFLLAQQINHEECSLYDTIPRPPATLPNLSVFDEIVFTSPSTVDAFIEVFGQPLPSNITLTPIGPITKEYLNSYKNSFDKRRIVL
jgi:uroporphyrinogen-III synthase